MIWRATWKVAEPARVDLVPPCSLAGSDNGWQESGVVGHNGNVHVMCLTFKTIQNDTAQYINE